MKKKMRASNSLTLDKLNDYVSYINILNSEGDRVFKNDYRHFLSNLQEQVRK